MHVPDNQSTQKSLQQYENIYANGNIFSRRHRRDDGAIIDDLPSSIIRRTANDDNNYGGRIDTGCASSGSFLAKRW
jgi:type IV secretory pathway component VirB8